MSQKDILFQSPAQIMKLETLSDGGVRIVVDTQELNNSEDMAKLFSLKKGKKGFFVFKDVEIVETDIPDYDPKKFEDDRQKTPSQRLRAVMYIYYTQVLNKEASGFDGYYRNWYEKQIEVWKEKLPSTED